MIKIKNISQQPLGQVLLATLLFCFIFLALFIGLYRAGSAYVLKERSQRAVNLTTLSAGAVYANGLQLVRESNVILMAAAAADIMVISAKISPMIAGLPLDLPLLIPAAMAADPKSRDKVQQVQRNLFGIGKPSGLYPLLIEGQAWATANENGLSTLPLPLFAYNFETATPANVMVPNMAVTFRTAADLLPELERSAYSLSHDGERHYFSDTEVEKAHNPRNPGQMRVKKNSSSPFAGWWVRKEKRIGNEEGSFLTHLAPAWALEHLRKFLKDLVLDVIDRDDPPCHTFTFLGITNSRINRVKKDLYQVGEVRVETEGLAAWDILKPYDIYQQRVDLTSFPALRTALQTAASIPFLDRILKNSDLLEGL